MSDSTVPPGCPDRNLLFGVLALQLDFINRSDLVLGLQAWGINRNQSLGQVLITRQALSPRRRVLLEEVVEEFLIQHDKDPARGLTAACMARTLSVDIESLTGPAMRGSLATLPSAPLTVAGPETCDPPLPCVGMSTSSGKRFRIIRPHARGALGEVFLAHDEELNRDVALKEIQAPYAGNPDSRSRFLLEAEITGSLEHPGIVPVYGLGLHPDGRPYYAMRFIRGESLYDALLGFHQADLPDRDPGERALALHALLSRFVGVCNAVAYAHSRGVVHRDIKPSNIMLGPYGETLVVDWGLAKAFNRPVTSDSREIPIVPIGGGASRATMLGQAVGTPSYMPPEQAAGKVDQVGPLSDVYSLGATLYNVLTGLPPYPGDDADEIISQVLLGRQMMPPRKVKREVPPALEAIVLKAMHYSPKDRYQTANELAQEVERWLADEPVQAYPEPAWQKMQRWTRRHRTLVSGFAVLVLTTLLGLGVGLYAVGREQERTRRNLLLAEDNLKLARKAVEDCFQVTRESPLLQQEKNRDVRRLLLKKALPFYRDFQSRTPDDPALRAEEGINLYRVAAITAEIDDKSKAIEWYQQAYALFSALAKANRNVADYQFHLARIDNDFAKLRYELGERDEALQLYQEAIALLEKLVSDGKSPDYESMLAGALNNLAVLRREEENFDEAMELHKRALGLQETLAKEYPDDLQYQANLASTQHNLGGFLAARKNWQAALLAYQEARKIRAQLVQKDPSQPAYTSDLADTLHNLGDLHREMKKPTEALAFFQSELELRYQLARPSSDVPEHHLLLANTYNALGVLRAAEGEFVEARKMYLSALEIQEGLAATQPDFPQVQIELAGTCNNLGQLIRDLDDNGFGGKLPEAFDWYKQAFGHLQKVRSPKQDPKAKRVLCNAHRGRADIQQRIGLYDAAIKDWNAALSLVPNDPDCRLQKAFALAHAGDHASAMTEVTGLEKLSSLEGDDFFNLACICALSSSAAGQDVLLPKSERKNRADENARRALNLLKRAQKTGLFDDVKKAEKDLKDKDLKSLQGRADFLAFKAMVLGKASSR